MLRKTLTGAVAALTLAGATVTTTSSAQAGFLGKVVAGVAGAVIGAAVVGAAASAARPEPVYRPGYRPAYGGGYGGCGFRNSPVFDEYGNRVGFRRVSAC